MEERISTPLGPILVTLSGETEDVRIERHNPPLPSLNGVAVDGAALLQIIFTRSLSGRLTVEVRFDGQGFAETGEWLECCSFDTPDGRLCVATRDMEWLEPEIRSSWAAYDPTGFRLEIDAADSGSGLPIAATWSLGPPPSSPDDITTWFAVDAVLP